MQQEKNIIELERQERKIIFLYPQNWNKEKNGSKYITNIKSIIAEANEIMKEVNRTPILHNSIVPEIKVIEFYGKKELIDEDEEEATRGLRICLNQIDSYDCYEECSDMLNTFDFKEKNISHIVSIKINLDNSFKTKWSIPLKTKDNKTTRFDAHVETTFNDFINVILGIMFDIACYHAFGLNKDFDYRRMFSKLKVKFIISEKYSDKRDIQKIYGNKNTEEIKNIEFLPLSLKLVNDVKKDIKDMEKCLKYHSEFIVRKTLNKAILNIKNSFVDLKSTIPVDLQLHTELYSYVNNSKEVIKTIVDKYEEISDSKSKLVLGIVSRESIKSDDYEKNIDKEKNDFYKFKINENKYCIIFSEELLYLFAPLANENVFYCIEEGDIE